MSIRADTTSDRAVSAGPFNDGFKRRVYTGVIRLNNPSGGGSCERHPHRHTGTCRRQRGTSLLIALILLAAITFLSVSGFNAGTANLRSVAGSVAILEATSAAQAAIDRTISSTLFTTQPQAVAAAPIDVDIDGDG